jgi:hypothetical protein
MSFQQKGSLPMSRDNTRQNATPVLSVLLFLLLIVALPTWAENRMRPIPPNNSGTVHGILQAEDDGTPHLFAYRRAVIRVMP